MRPLPLAVVLVLGLGLPLRAEPLDRQQVPAGAKWLVHIDVDAARSAQVVQKLYDHWLGNEEAKQVLRVLRPSIGAGLLEDVHSLTVFGKRFAPQDGVVILRAKVNRDLIARHLERDPSHQTSSYGGHELHTWVQREPGKGGQTLTGCLHGPTTVVLGQDPAAVKATLDLLDKKAPSLAGSGSPLDLESPPGTVLAAGAVGLADLAGTDVPFLSPIVRKSQVLVLAVGEHKGEVFGQARLVTNSADTAGQIRDIIEGFRAAAELQHSANNEATDVLKALKVSASDKTVTADWRMPAEELLALIEKKLAKQQQ
jgi:hypothetical protein